MQVCTLLFLVQFRTVRDGIRRTPRVPLTSVIQVNALTYANCTRRENLETFLLMPIQLFDKNELQQTGRFEPEFAATVHS